ncbi:helix-turn-helix domain-containing protein [Chengkuizengella axinellae]|uniref:Helix-turn-helix domain-containing protein n=1 Tax=Chengkuizengella axinellae TaxID=3064388 RepID=A0ABT9J6G6_9BACL|nr:helix-turn-helix domain-containing protein [Chengkuizengella sp. 2205SS18-9]MDP5277063.1 helix-turn-helix domain-containing protein [Chengkuizengella sp. 2205SS18-9]
MQEKSNSKYTAEDRYFLDLIENAKLGDKQSMNEILKLFEKDILVLAKYIKMPKDDAIQAIITEFLSLILKNDNEGEKNTNK